MQRLYLLLKRGRSPSTTVNCSRKLAKNAVVFTHHNQVAVLSLALIGNRRRDKYRRRSDARCRGFSITRLEGSRWCLRRTRSGYGESTGRRVEVVAGRAASAEARGTAGGDVLRFKMSVLRASGAAVMEYLQIRVNGHTAASACVSTSKVWNGKPATTSLRSCSMRTPTTVEQRSVSG